MNANPESEAFFLRLIECGGMVIRADGVVFNGKTLKVYERHTARGYISIAAKDGKRTRHILAHRLVHLALVGPLDPSDEVIHRDGNRSNNAPANLARTDASGVLLHSYATGTRGREEVGKRLRSFYDHNLSRNAKLNAGQVAAIYDCHARGETKAAIAKAFGIDRKAVIQILRGESYRSVLPADRQTAVCA